MGGQVLGGGVIVLVAVLLWLVYLLPTWHSRHQFNASERNAVRLNQAIRVLAETSETPEEVRLELNARTALAQQRLAKRVQAELEASALEDLRTDLAAARATPSARRGRARRRARLISTVLLLAGLGLIGWGVWETVQTGSQVLLWAGAGVSLLALIVLQRMARVAAHAARPAVAAVDRPAIAVQDVSLAVDRRITTWTPRALPVPLVQAPGSRAAAELDAAEAREAVRRAAAEQEQRERAERLRPAPVPITAFTSMGVVDDAEIEAHVRDLLRRRAAG